MLCQNAPEIPPAQVQSAPERPVSLRVAPAIGRPYLVRELRVAARMMPRMYLVPLRGAWRQLRSALHR